MPFNMNPFWSALGGAVVIPPSTITATGTQFIAAQAASYRDAGAKIYLLSTVGGNVSAFVFMVKGTSATLDMRNDAAFYDGAALVSVDGGALVSAPNTGSVYTLFSGLADTWHQVSIQTGTIWGTNNLYLLPSVATLSVTGVNPAWVTANYWLYAGDSNPLIHTSGALRSNVASYVPEYLLTAAITSLSAIGSIRFRAAATKLYIFASATHVFYSRNGGAPVRIATDGRGGFVEGLDGALATYTVWSSGNNYLSVGADAALVDVGAKKRFDAFGDSIKAGDSVAGAYDQTRGDVETLGVAAALGFAGATYGLSGQTIAQLQTNITTILAALPAAGPLDVAELAIGRNDVAAGFDAARQTSYAAIIDALIAKGYGRVICRGVLPAPVWTAFNAGIESLVAARADPKVVYVNTDSWSGIATGDGTHPTIAGYTAIRSYAIPAYTPLIP